MSFCDNNLKVTRAVVNLFKSLAQTISLLGHAAVDVDDVFCSSDASLRQQHRVVLSHKRTALRDNTQTIKTDTAPNVIGT